MNDETYFPSGALPTPEPMVDGLDVPFWEGLRAEELRLQWCGSCRAHQWGPEWICHRCLSDDALEWVVVPALGTIYSWERVWHPVTPALADSVPYVVVLIEVDGTGVRVVGNLLGDSEQDIRIGTEVSGVFEHHQGHTLLQWRVGR